MRFSMAAAHFRAQARRGEIFATDEEILRETLAVRLKRNDMAMIRRPAPVPEACPGNREQRHIGSRGLRGGAACREEQRVRNENCHPRMTAFKVNAFAGQPHQPRPPVAGLSAKRNSRIKPDSRAMRAIAPDGIRFGEALDEIPLTSAIVALHKCFVATNFYVKARELQHYSILRRLHAHRCRTARSGIHAEGSEIRKKSNFPILPESAMWS